MPYLFKKYYPIRNLIFFAGEGGTIFLSLVCVHYFFLGSDSYSQFILYRFSQAFLVTIIFQLCLYFFDLYDLSEDLSIIDTATSMTQAFGVGCVVLGGIYYSLPVAVISTRVFWTGYLVICCTVMFWRAAYYFILKRRMFVQNIFIVGTGTLASDICREVDGKHDSGYRIAAFFGNSEPEYNPRHVPVYDEVKSILDLSGIQMVQKIVVALDDRRGTTPVKELLDCKLRGLKIDQGVNFYEGLTGKIMVEKVDPSNIIFSRGFTLSRWRYLVKRILDISLALIGLICSLPITLISAIIIKLESAGPIFYTQVRVGENNNTFRVVKFRSMAQDAEKDGAVWAQKNDTRVTRFGGFIRRVRIDEIPQMWNVLKGEMSFVGPRPERPVFVEQLSKTIPYYAVRHFVKPGLTGWAQICYPYGASEEDALRKLEYDLYYMKNISILMDLMVVFQTVKTVLFRKGAR